MRAWLLLLAGCIDVHDFHGATDGGVTDGAIVLPDIPASCAEVSQGANLGWGVGDVGTLGNGTDVGVAGADWELHFNGSAMHFPFSYKVATKELLALGAGCADASLSGVAIVPGGRSDSGSVGTSKIVPLATGPSIVSYQITWKAQLTCLTATVTSTWTMFPDGRITRRDVLTDPNPVGGTCACAQVSPNGVTATTETLYASDAISQVALAGGTTIQQDSTSDGAIPDAVCLTGGVDARLISLAGPGSAGKLYSVLHNTDIGLAYHFFDGTPLAAAEGTSSTVPVPVGVGCDVAIAALAGFVQDVALSLDGVALAATARDGIYGEMDPGVTVHDIATFSVRSGVPAPPGFAIGLHFVDGPRTQYAVYRNNAPLSPGDARVQYVDDHHAVLWLRDGFGGANAACDEVRVVAMP